MNDLYVAGVESMRSEKDAAFREDPGSPIPDRHKFVGLTYYDVDPAYRVPTRLRLHDKPTTLRIPTSDGSERVYRNVGEFTIQVPTGEVTLQAYDTGATHSLFVPFRDATSGKETYGAGRYLDVDAPHGDEPIVIDLNLAYHPYCAYNDAYSCPLPPPENWLQIPIRAGERLPTAT